VNEGVSLLDLYTETYLAPHYSLRQLRGQ